VIGALEPSESTVQRRTCHRDHGAVVPSSPQASTQDVPIHLTHLNVQQQDVELPARCQSRLHLRPILMQEWPRGKGTTVRGAQLTPPQGWTKVAYLGLQCKWRQGHAGCYYNTRSQARAHRKYCRGAAQPIQHPLGHAAIDALIVHVQHTQACKRGRHRPWAQGLWWLWWNNRVRVVVC
jgi:hypothetical protein